MGRNSFIRAWFLAAIVVAAASVPVPAAGQQAGQAPETFNGTAGYHFLLARHYEGLGRIDDAIASLQKAMQLVPASAEIRAELAALYARQDRPQEAMAAAEAALKIDPDNHEANRILGSILAVLAEQRQPLRPGDDVSQYLPRAIAALEKARGEAPDLNLLLTLGRLQLRAGRHEQAIASLRRIFEEQPQYTEGAMLLAAAQEGAGRLDDATATLEGALELNPTFFRGFVKLIELYERQRRWKDAAGAYARAIAANPRADLTSGYAAALVNSGAPEKARDLLTAAIQKQTKPDPGLLYLLAEAQRVMKDFDAASTTVRRLREGYPDDARGLIVEAELLAAQGKKAAAADAFGALVKRVPDEPSFAYRYAQLLQDTGRFADAENVLRDLIAKDPLDADALNALGYMFAERGEKLAEAVQLLQRALTIQPGNPSFLDSLGWAYFKQGKLAEADKPLSDAAAQMPQNSVIQDHLGDLRFRQSRFADAVAAWQRALSGDGESIDRAAIEKKLRDAQARMK